MRISLKNFAVSEIRRKFTSNFNNANKNICFFLKKRIFLFF